MSLCQEKSEVAVGRKFKKHEIILHGGKKYILCSLEVGKETV